MEVLSSKTGGSDHIYGVAKPESKMLRGVHRVGHIGPRHIHAQPILKRFEPDSGRTEEEKAQALPSSQLG